MLSYTASAIPDVVAGAAVLLLLNKLLRAHYMAYMGGTRIIKGLCKAYMRKLQPT